MRSRSRSRVGKPGAFKKAEIEGLRLLFKNEGGDLRNVGCRSG